VAEYFQRCFHRELEESARADRLRRMAMTQPKAGAASATRQQQRIDDLCAASIRALSGDAGLHFRGRRLYRGDKALPPFAPHLNPVMTDDFASFRGAADAMALRLRLSDAALHQRLRPTEPLPRMLFEMLEQFRVEALAPADMPGWCTTCDTASRPGRWRFSTAA
jgi:cobaltochelatase CobT